MVYIKNAAAEDNPDKRQFDRRHSLFYLRIYDTSSGDMLGHLVDLSEGGLMMVSDKPMKPGEITTIAMQLPSAKSDHNRLELSVKAKWSRKEANPHLYDTGLEFIDPSVEIMNMIRQLIAAYMFNSY